MKVCFARATIGQEIGIFRRLLAGLPWLVAGLDAAQPFYPEIAFPARDHRAQGIALLGAQRLTVHREGQNDVVQRFLDRQRTVHAGGIRAFQHQPFRVRLEAGLVKQHLERHARIHDVVNHAVGELAAVELGAAPLHAGIRRAFQEIDPVHARHAPDVFHREHQRLLDEAVDHQPVVGGIDFGDTAVVALEAKSRRA